MIKKTETDIDVLTAAERRVKNLFSNGIPVNLCVSGGKDSICLQNIVYEMCLTGQVDKSLLTVVFIDEEAIFPCVERVVKGWRMKWLEIGVKFDWYCIEVKHFNCFNTLSEDETFICWDRYKKDVWVRDMPPYAITSHPSLNARKENYQSFMDKLCKNQIRLVGVRASESMTRWKAIASTKQNAKMMYYPIYDWKDTDVWKYIRDRELDFPDAYIYMYQTGNNKREMRISQYFSVDTAKVLVNMNQYYPGLHERICKREPNAYMAMLYFDTELFRRKKSGGRKSDSGEDEIDYKAKVLELLNDDSFFDTKQKCKQRKDYQILILTNGKILNQKIFKAIYNALIGGDPKNRAYRHIFMSMASDYQKEKGGING